MLVCLWIGVALPGGAAAQPRSEVDTAAAHRAALAWLALVDSGAYSASLDSAAPMLRRMIASGEQWEEFLRGARNGLGLGVIRELLEVELEPSLPVMLDGRYLRLTFRIRRARRTATEAVVLQELDDGWRVAMYGLRGEP
jgi:hypothetical protein